MCSQFCSPSNVFYETWRFCPLSGLSFFTVHLVHTIADFKVRSRQQTKQKKWEWRANEQAAGGVRIGAAELATLCNEMFARRNGGANVRQNQPSLAPSAAQPVEKQQQQQQQSVVCSPQDMNGDAARRMYDPDGLIRKVQHRRCFFGGWLCW
jgi:hypothetical protein